MSYTVIIFSLIKKSNSLFLFGLFWLVLVYFDFLFVLCCFMFCFVLFWFILFCFSLFWFVLVRFSTFLFILVRFGSFQYVLIHFGLLLREKFFWWFVAFSCALISAKLSAKLVGNSCTLVHSGAVRCSQVHSIAVRCNQLLNFFLLIR